MDYSSTVHLPKTSFPMRADLPNLEPGFIAIWEKLNIYGKIQLKNKGKKKFVLHDGPPYANGHIHIGHALNKILKDVIVKYRSLAGFDSPYVPGWDCHGLPIEHALMKELKANKHTVDILDFRKKAAAFAMKFVEIQKQEFKRLGIFGDWENPYLTLTPAYETAILKAFRELFEKGLIYRSKKPVQWCASCETALAEAEVEYEEKESPAVFIKFKSENGRFFILWTTTPWTLPANVGMMLHPDLDYSVVRIKKLNEEWILLKNLAVNLLESKLKFAPSDYEILETNPGKSFAGEKYTRIFPKSGDRDFGTAILSSEVSSEEGTGIVHIAPGHGALDYTVGHVQNKLPVLSPVNDAGKYSDEIGMDELKGLFVLSKGNQKILEMLGGGDALVYQEKIRHSYPHCWRCKNPVIFRATYQWFLNVDHENLRQKLLGEIENVNWIPAYGKNRIKGMLEQRPDWCLSRQRLWGTPIPIFYCKACGEPLDNPGAINMVEEKIGLEPDGSDAWFREKPGYFLDHIVPFKCKCGQSDFERGHDILDVWFDSGVSHEAVLKGKDTLEWPASLYLEGSDQHRGWFQSSLIPSVALHGRAPYENVLTHGFIVGGDGKKMSKSIGNVVAPETILKEYGADILRLWVAASDYREDIRISKDILKGVAENYRKIRNTLRYLIGNVHGFDPAKDTVGAKDMLEIDRWALNRLVRTVEAARKAYDTYEFHRVAVAVIEFCILDCSSFYFDILKDRLYTLKKDSLERRSAQTVLHHMLSSLLPLLAPILPFTAEETWLLGREDSLWKEESVFLSDFPSLMNEWKDDGLEARWNQVRKIREKANLSLETARKDGQIGSSLEAKVILNGGEGVEKEVLKNLEKNLASVFIVSQVEIQNGSGPLEVKVVKADGKKCARCWRYEITVGEDKTHTEICLRCVGALA